MNNVFIMGSKGIPAQYGGFETFVEELVKRKTNENIKYYVTCMSDNNQVKETYGATCFHLKTPEIGSSRAVLYDLKSIDFLLKYIEQNKLKDCIIYILACRIGPFMSFYQKKAKKLGVKIYLNPDGHEWKRSKWNKAIRQYWKISEKMMVKKSDLIICDSKGIESYIKEDYKQFNPRTTYISYGAEKIDEYASNNTIANWFQKFSVKSDNYFLIVGRFVPENNYELIIREFLKTNTTKDLVIITNVEKNDFFESLKSKTNFHFDKRIKFVGTVYDQKLLNTIRSKAFAYIHGHSVGGTNPSLLEALATTSLNLLFDVNFNKEVGSNSALYFTEKSNSLKNLIHHTEHLSDQEIEKFNSLSSEIIENRFNWSDIVNKYEKLFLNKGVY